MNVFKENQEQELYKLIFHYSPELDLNKQDQLFARIEKLAQQYYSLLAKLGDLTINASGDYFNRTGDAMSDKQEKEYLMRLVDKNQPKLSTIYQRIAELNNIYFGLDELLDQHRPFNNEYMEIGV
tara:strand:+ start:180 stop:554 length:375 start_codon:yes stop_codon:yes gene_type:complete